jgi:hypothetical protein
MADQQPGGNLQTLVKRINTAQADPDKIKDVYREQFPVIFDRSELDKFPPDFKVQINDQLKRTQSSR